MPTNQEQLAILADLTFDVLRPYFYQPLSKVAVEFGVCATVFKKRCRDLGVKRWPFRKIRSLRRSTAKPNCTAAERRVMQEQIESIHDEASHVAAVGDHSKAAVLLMDGAAAPAWRRSCPIVMAPAALWTSYIEPTVPLKTKRKAPAPAAARSSTSSSADEEDEQDEERQQLHRFKRARTVAAVAAASPFLPAKDVPSFTDTGADDIMSALMYGLEDDADSLDASDRESEMSLSDDAEFSCSDSDAELEFGDLFGQMSANVSQTFFAPEPIMGF